MRSSNNLRQIQLGVHNFAATSEDRLPPIHGEDSGPGFSVFGAILPYLDQSNLYINIYSHEPELNLFVAAYLSPADPSIDPEWLFAGLTSYAANARAFQAGSRLDATFTDGTSNTIAFAEHYSCCGDRFPGYTVHFMWPNVLPYGPHPGSFAERSAGDVYPVTTGDPPVSRPSFEIQGPRLPSDDPSVALPPITTPFQVAPPVSKCHRAIPQTPHRSGMLTACMDGSVRTVSPGISMETFWGAVTPDGGEVLADW
jgi:hypothetical protein